MWPYHALKNMKLRTNAVQEWVIGQHVLWAVAGKDIPNSKDLMLMSKCCPSSYEWLVGGRGCGGFWWLWHCRTICSMNDSRKWVVDQVDMMVILWRHFLLLPYLLNNVLCRFLWWWWWWRSRNRLGSLNNLMVLGSSLLLWIYLWGCELCGPLFRPPD